MNKRTLLFVGAHPDDETFGIGGTLAKYASEGIAVYYACATRGEAGTVSAWRLQGYDSPGDLRWAELQCASTALGLKGIFHLGYRDSGMPGSEDNRNPESLAMTQPEQVAERIVKLIRDLKPQVVVTHDPAGGYGHPDHVAVNRATMLAFKAAGDPALYPSAGVAYQPHKLYFHIFSRRFLRIVTRLMPLFGGDPRKFGRNKDIDLSAIARISFPVNASVSLPKWAIAIRERARKCHASQVGGGRPPLYMRLLGITNKVFGEKDCFTRAYPPPEKRREKDLFEGIATKG